MLWVSLVWSFDFYLNLAHHTVTVHVSLLKRPVNHFKPVHQSRQQMLRAYCPNFYTVPIAIKDRFYEVFDVTT